MADEWPTENIGARTTMRGVDWGLLDEFDVLGDVSGEVWLSHDIAGCAAGRIWPKGLSSTLAVLILAVEEHMKECRG